MTVILINNKKYMEEIEVKAKIKDINKTKEILEKMGCIFSESTTQDDIIFLPEGVEFCDIKKDIPVVRVRDSNGVIILTLKKRIENGNELIKLEKEVVVDKKDEIIEIIKNMNYHEVLRVNKKRIRCEYKDTDICIDDVFNLGFFIEVEKLSQNEDDLLIQNSLFDFLKSIGINEEDRVLKGYDTMLYEKQLK